MNPSFSSLVSTHWLTLSIPFVGGIVAALVTHAIRNWVARSSSTSAFALWLAFWSPSLSRRYGKAMYSRRTVRTAYYMRPRRHISHQAEKDSKDVDAEPRLRHN
jgi:hypothetical protein